jgi:hypothetical protein
MVLEMLKTRLKIFELRKQTQYIHVAIKKGKKYSWYKKLMNKLNHEKSN